MATVKDFSVEEKLTAVLTLQKIDSKIDEIKTLKGELPMEVKDLEDELAGLETRMSNIDAELQSINEYIETRNTAKKEAQALIKKYEKQQESVKNNREFEAINKEIEMQELEVQLMDKHIRDANIKIAEVNDMRIRAERKMQGINESLAIKRKELEKIIGDTEKEEKVLSVESEKAKEKVEPRLLSAYERIRNSYRNGLAIVPIMRDSCGGCFNVLPPQRQTEIRQRKKITVCEHCGRILVDNDLNEQVQIS